MCRAAALPVRKCVGNRLEEVVHRDLGEWLLHITVRDEVERAVQLSGLLDHSIDVRVDSGFVPSIDNLRRRLAAAGTDGVGNVVKLGRGTAS